MSEALTVGELRFEVRRRPEGGAPSVHLEGEALILSAPAEITTAALRAFVEGRQLWIYKRLLERDALSTPATPYAEGDRRLYLGRRHQIRIIDEAGEPLSLRAGRFELRRAALPEARAHFIRWYTARAAPWITRRAEEIAPQMAQPRPEVEIHDLGFRWSSRRGAILRFHWALIQAPPPIVEYVIVHELAHAVDLRHSARFWGAVEARSPDYLERKAWLEAHGAALIAR
ncbi:M48 family metallopeptidase [Myxococcota bacterium]|nr:M48 family metallopeptidase [Myxococcota bacterium]MBU1431344.1 M48 family metallopeptidase [Myxococcota bacterium]MBU1900280.1 M48 family metallopeptidase [Myxococcota bacterium]